MRKREVVKVSGKVDKIIDLYKDVVLTGDTVIESLVCNKLTGDYSLIVTDRAYISEGNMKGNLTVRNNLTVGLLTVHGNVEVGGHFEIQESIYVTGLTVVKKALTHCRL
jgi:hypothetical protein